MAWQEIFKKLLHIIILLDFLLKLMSGPWQYVLIWNAKGGKKERKKERRKEGIRTRQGFG